MSPGGPPPITKTPPLSANPVSNLARERLLDGQAAIWYANAGPFPMNVSSSIYLVLAATGAPEAHEQQLLDVDGTVLLQFGLFLVAMYALTQLLWKPYLRIRQERGARVEGFKEEAKRMDSDAAARYAKVEAQLAEARRVGSAERARVRVAAQKREHEVIAAAQAAAQQTLSEARGRVDTALAGERANLAARAEQLGQQAAEKVLGRKVA